jgi:hypothetical protein
MPTNIRVIHAGDFIRATPEGELDLEKSKELLLGVASTAASLADYEILLDMRKAQGKMSLTDMWYLAAELSEHREAFSRRTAVLCPLERFDLAGFFALCAENRGFRVGAFTSYEDAMEWLIDNGD